MQKESWYCSLLHSPLSILTLSLIYWLVFYRWWPWSSFVHTICQCLSLCVDLMTSTAQYVALKQILFRESLAKIHSHSKYSSPRSSTSHSLCYLWTLGEDRERNPHCGNGCLYNKSNNSFPSFRTTPWWKCRLFGTWVILSVSRSASDTDQSVWDSNNNPVNVLCVLAWPQL